MKRVMMRCQRDWGREIFTGVEIPRRSGLKGLTDKLVACSHCKRHHFVRRPYFEGDDPGDQGNEALEVGHSFAAELGVLIGGMGIIELYLPTLLTKATGVSARDAATVIGTFPSYSQRLNLLYNLANSHPKNSQINKDFGVVVSKLRRAGSIRDKYAHALYSVAQDRMHVHPYHGDANPSKDKAVMVLSTDDICRDVEELKAIKTLIHGFLHRGERPTR